MSIDTVEPHDMNGTATTIASSAQKSPSSVWPILWMEARSVSAWFAAATFLRVLVVFLIRLASYRRDCADNECVSELPKYLMNHASFGANLLLGVLPHKLQHDAAPGFIYASPWILMSIRNIFGTFPNVPLRITEGVLGRLNFKELGFVLLIHFACAISTSLMLKHLISKDAYPLVFNPIEYSDKSLWLVDLIRETLITATFCVAILVIPELLSVNRLPKWYCVPLLYPIYSIPVDANGKGSIFGPNVLYALAALSKSETTNVFGQSLARLFGSLLGGVLGGLIMVRFFPDHSPT